MSGRRSCTFHTTLRVELVAKCIFILRHPAIYRSRTSIERFFGRMKQFRRLNNITVRGWGKVTVHCTVPLIVAQAWALAVPESPRLAVAA